MSSVYNLAHMESLVVSVYLDPLVFLVQDIPVFQVLLDLSDCLDMVLVSYLFLSVVLHLLVILAPNFLV